MISVFLGFFYLRHIQTHIFKIDEGISENYSDTIVIPFELDFYKVSANVTNITGVISDQQLLHKYIS